MFNLYRYFKDKKANGCESMSEIKAIFQSRGWSQLDGLIQNIREGSSPCLCVDVGTSGVLSLCPSLIDRQYLTFYTLFKVNIRDDESTNLDEIFEKAKKIGLAVLMMMVDDSHEVDSTCRGFNQDDITYERVGNAGSYYGYAFSFTITSDNG